VTNSSRTPAGPNKDLPSLEPFFPGATPRSRFAGSSASSASSTLRGVFIGPAFGERANDLQ